MIITTPIFYVNARPHIGHAYTLVLADAISRWSKYRQLKSGGPPVRLCTGTDEHGIKVWRAARDNNKDVAEWVRHTAGQFNHLSDVLNIGYSRFLRTSADSDHRETVCRFWKRLLDAGAIYLGEHTGWYSASEERFIPENELASQINSRLEMVQETNWKFRLHVWKERVLKWLQSHNVVYPESRLFDILPFLMSSDNSDLSVSRPADIMKWGIPVPNDPSQLIYVWLDALSGYLTVNQRNDGAVYHVIGKDILKFHAVYWPAFLMAAQMEHLLPSKLIVHGHWKMNGEKMSKSLGNVVDPLSLLDTHQLPADALRWYLLKKSRLRGDEEYDTLAIIEHYNKDLANLGNLLSRVCSSKLNISAHRQDLDRKTIDRVARACQKASCSYDKMDFQTGILSVVESVGICDHYVSESAPWRSSDASVVHHTVIACLNEHILPLLSPVIPATAARLADACDSRNAAIHIPKIANLVGQG